MLTIHLIIYAYMQKQTSIFFIALSMLALLTSGCDKTAPSSPAPAPPSQTPVQKTIEPKVIPPPVEQSPFQDPKRTYVGSASCRSCHERFYELWAPSHHGKAMQPWSAELASHLPEQTEPIEVEGNLYQAFITPERGWVTENKTNVFDVAYTLGGKNYYNLLTLMPDGRLQVLPVFYDVQSNAWRNTTMSMLRHFDDGRTDSPLKWRDSMLTFNAECFRCHVSQSESNYDPETDTYHTTWNEPGISCESCHGPSSEHIRVCEEAPEGSAPEDLKIIGWWEMDREQRDSACAGCHTKGAAITDTFDTGDRYWDNYDLTTFDHIDYYADGRDLGENYTMGSWWLSPCVQHSDLACTHCHTSSGRDKHKDNPSAACLPCHQSRVEEITSHSHHDNLTCIDCHMPMNPFGGMNQSDHSMRPPMPQLSQAVGSRNACIMCHKDKTDQWALDAIKSWHPDFEKDTAFELKRALLVQALKDYNWEKIPEIHDYIKDPNSDPLFVTSLIRLLPPSNDESERVILRKLVTDAKHPLVRSAAAAALDADEVPANRPALFKALSDEYRLVRIRAAERLASLPEEAIPPEYAAVYKSALKEMWNAYNLRLDHWESHFNTGNIYMRRHELKKAAEKYDRAHELRDDIAPPLINASMAYAQLGKMKEAEDRLIKATQLPEPSTEAHFNLGLLYAEQGRTDEAKEQLYKSLKVWPGNARAAFNLAVLTAGSDYPECFRLLKLAIKQDPLNPRYIQTLAYYYIQDKQNDLAKKLIEDAFRQGVRSRDLQLMYRQLVMPPNR